MPAWSLDRVLTPLQRHLSHLPHLPSIASHIPLKRSGMHLLMLLLVITTLSLMINFVRQMVRSTQLEAERIELATEVALLEASTQELEGAVSYVESDVYVERVAREQLGYAREGDTVVLPQFIIPTATPAPDDPDYPTLPIPDEPNWLRWWRALFAPE